MSLYSLTPNAADPFSRYMAQMFDEKQVIGVPTAFQAFFGDPANGSKTFFSPDANTIDIDIIRGNEKIAKMIPRGLVSRSIGSLQKNTNKEKYSSFTRVFPLAEEIGDITSDQLLFRSVGEKAYGGKTQLQRLRDLALGHVQEHIRRMTRLFEVLCSDAILTGKHAAIFGTTNTDLIYDFRRNSALIITPTNKWDSGSQDILGDIDGGCAKMRELGHVNPDMGIIGTAAMDSFIKDTTVKSVADNRRFELIEVTTNNPVPSKFNKFVESGLTPRGRLRTPAGYTLWLFTYNDVYTNDSDVAVPYMPVDQMLIAYSGARADRCFGPNARLPITNAKAAMYQELFGFDITMAQVPPNIKNSGKIVEPAAFYADAYESGDGTKVSVRTQAAPIFVPTQTDAFVTLKDL